MRSPASVTVSILALALVAFTVGAIPAAAQEDPPVLAVNGHAEVRAEPDMATVRLGIVEQANTAAEAQDAVNAVARRILDAVLEAGIEQRHVQTANLNLHPVYSHRTNPGEPRRITAYQAMNTISVRVESLERVGPVIDAGLGAGANQLEGVSFGLRDDLPAREDALKAAIADARAKAEAMAEALGVDLAEILSVAEGGVSLHQPAMDTGRMMAMQEGVATPVSPGEVSVSASVSIRYRIASN